jgi:hypothetical protein
MTVTLVRPAHGGPTRFSIATPVRVRPVPAMDPPYDDEEPRRPAGMGADQPHTPRPGQPERPDRRPGEAHRAIRRYLDLVLEVLGGFRPVGHLRALTAHGRFDAVALQLARLGGPSVLRPGSGLVRVTGDRIRLRHLRICEVRDGAVEAAAVLVRGESVRAMTLRLERDGDLWLCTHLHVL